MSQQMLMKDKLAYAEIKQIGDVLSQLFSDFDSERFLAVSLQGLPQRELKQRVSYIVDVLSDFLTDDFEVIAAQLTQLKVLWPDSSSDSSWHSFAAWPILDFIGKKGIDQPELALSTLAELTGLFTAEFAMRHYVEHHYAISLNYCLKWTQHSDEHVRRLASEALRPKLPWAKHVDRLIDQPNDIFTVLDKLKDDESLYVRTSVANNLNDISKNHAQQVIERCKTLQDDGNKVRQWIIRKALRTLLKQGNQAALTLLGYSVPDNLDVTSFVGSKSRVNLGEKLTLTLLLTSTSSSPQKLMIDYSVHLVKANGARTEKVFKWANVTLDKHGVIQLSKSHSFKSITTRTYYSGQHAIELIINGQRYSQFTFDLKV